MPPDPRPVSDLPAPPSARPITEFAPEPNYVSADTQAQLRAWEELRIGLEAGGATALAALLSGAYCSSERDVVGVLCCGGNLDIAAMLRAAL
jgi:hypothetical protein